MTKLADYVLGQASQATETSGTATTTSKQATTVVDPKIARKRVVSDTLGEIVRRKTEDKNRVELVANGEIIGEARAIYKTKTQRSWTVVVNGICVENQHTISKGLRKLEAELATQTETNFRNVPQSETTVTTTKTDNKTVVKVAG